MSETIEGDGTMDGETEDYTQKQDRRDRQYERDYEAWVKAMSPEDRAKAEGLGVCAPHVERRGGGCFEGDLADSPLASENPDIIGTVEPDAGAQPSEDAIAQATSDALATFCARIRSTSNPLMVFDAVCYGTGVLALDGASETELAGRHGVSRSAFSKRAVKWCETFGIKASRGMKSEQARETYSRLTRARWHERKRGKSGG